MMPHAPLLSDVDEREAVRQLLLLDPCSAWRADLADAGLPEPMDEALADQWLLWLQIATVFDRLRSLPVRARAAYARSTGALWETAERITGAARFARVGEVMATWRGAAPELAGFRELLWAVEQGEAEGALRVALAALFSLRSIIPDADLRRAYAAAQEGRVLRTIGMLEPALCAFQEASSEAQRLDDQWLFVRAKLGTGVVYQARGNYPAARELFNLALESARDSVDLQIGAHLGLVSAARATEEYDVALEHGWLALQSARGNNRFEVEALTILAALSVEVGEFDAALASYRLAMSKGPSHPMRLELLRYVVQVSVGMHDTEEIRNHLPTLVAAVECMADPWQEAQGRRVVGDALEHLGDRELARRYFMQSRAIAIRRGYAELLYRADDALLRLAEADARAIGAQTAATRTPRPVTLGQASQAVIGQLCCLA